MAHPRSLRLVLGTVLVLALPQLLLGPDLVADDFVWARNAEFLGAWQAGGVRQEGRPGAWFLYAATFGTVGTHPLALAIVQVVLWAAAAASLLRCLGVFLEARVALVVTLVWLVSPSHTALELWASTSQAWVAIILVCEGTRLVRTAQTRRSLIVGAACLMGAGAFYEVAIGVVPLGWVLAVSMREHRLEPRSLGVGAALATPALVWSQLAGTVYPASLVRHADVVEHVGTPFASGVPVEGGAARLLAVLGLGLALAAWVGARSRGWDEGRATVLVGVAIVVLGAAPATRAYAAPIGIGNRLLAVSSIGAALAWVGAWRTWGGALGGSARAASVVVAAVTATTLRVGFLDDWMAQGDEARAVAVRVAGELERTRVGSVVLPDPPAVGRWTYGLLDGWNTTAAVQLAAGDPTLVVEIDRADCLRSGPTPDRPLAQFGEVEDRRSPSCGGR